jgi:hypothetical protein
MLADHTDGSDSHRAAHPRLPARRRGPSRSGAVAASGRQLFAKPRVAIAAAPRPVRSLVARHRRDPRAVARGRRGAAARCARSTAGSRCAGGHRRVPQWVDDRLAANVQAVAGQTWSDTIPAKLFPIRRCLLGCVLLRREVFTTVPSPWFLATMAATRFVDDDEGSVARCGRRVCAPCATAACCARALGFGVVSTGRPWNLRAAARADDTVSIDCIRGRW